MLDNVHAFNLTFRNVMSQACCIALYHADALAQAWLFASSSILQKLLRPNAPMSCRAIALAPYRALHVILACMVKYAGEETVKEMVAKHQAATSIWMQVSREREDC
jgi:hypothetical protein